MGAGMATGVLCTTEQRDFWHNVEGLKVVDFPQITKAKVIAAGIAGSWRSSLAWETGTAAEAFKIAGIPSRLGVDGRKLNKLLTRPLMVPVEPLAHRVRFYLELVEEFGVRTDRAEFFAPADLGIEPVKSAVLLCPGSDFGANHEWELENWLEIGRRLLAKGRRVTVCSVDGGRDLGRQLAEQLGGDVEFFHATPLAGALPLLAVHALVVAADGSLPHLSAYAGTTCVTLFGPNDPAWKRPLGRRHAVVRRHVECAPCLLEKCPMDLRCQRELELERVWQAVEEKLV
jgi:ADP-heptose:LPS heptosyltransferase